MKRGDKIAFIACSNGLDSSLKEKVLKVKGYFEEKGLRVQLTDCIYQKKPFPWAKNKEERAEVLMSLYLDPEVMAIFDISGGDLANQLLPYLDFEIITSHPKPFFGYSDLTVLLNAIHHKGKQSTFLFQAMHLAALPDELREQRLNTICSSRHNNMPISIKYGKAEAGTLLGGNIRCLLKLSGTPYMPELADAVLLLESNSGDRSRIETYASQLEQMGVFNQVKGIILGRFTELSSTNESPIAIFLPYAEKYNIALMETDHIGHHKESIIAEVGSLVSF